MPKIVHERRARRRYDMRLAIHYRVSQRGTIARVGSGTTCEISTDGLSFRTRKPLPVGAHIEMEIEWPARYSDVYPMDLQCTGFVLRSLGGRTAVRMMSRKFRILSNPARMIPASA
jgi:hypothetical protein